MKVFRKIQNLVELAFGDVPYSFVLLYKERMACHWQHNYK